MSNLEFTGIVENHVHYCENGPQCPCIPIIESYDGVKRYRKLKNREMEEEQQLAIQARLDRESSYKERDTEPISHKHKMLKKPSGGVNKSETSASGFLEV